MELRLSEGVHTLQVILQGGLPNSDPGSQEDCVLLDQRFDLRKRTQSSFETGWIILGCALGAIVVVAVLVILGRKYRDRLKHVFHTAVFELLKVCFGFAFDGADISTDTITFHRAVISDALGVSDSNYILGQGYKIAYIAIFCLAAVVSVLGLSYRFIQGRALYRALNESHESMTKGSLQSQTEKEVSVSEMKLKLSWELEKTKRDIMGCSISLSGFVAEGTSTTTSGTGGTCMGLIRFSKHCNELLFGRLCAT
jgi:hypothetical protein